jgi:hypothetical protein
MKRQAVKGNRGPQGFSLEGADRFLHPDQVLAIIADS